jgi:hypothetical protein
MSATNFTPIQLYRTSTAAAAPTAGNLAAGELAINLTDEKLFFKNAAGTVKVLASSGASTVGGSNTQVQYNNNGVLGGSANFVFDGTNVGISAATPASKLDIGSGDLRFSSTGQRIIGNMSSGSLPNRLAFQSSTLNTSTGVHAIPNGSSVVSGFRAESDSAFTNGQFASMDVNGGTDVRITSGIRGSGTYVPLTFYTNGTESMRITSAGDVGIGTASPSARLHVNGAAARLLVDFSGDNYYDAATHYFRNYASTATSYISVGTSSTLFSTNTTLPLTLGTNNAERMRIDSSGNVGIGTSSPVTRLTVDGGAASLRTGNQFRFYPTANNNYSQIYNPTGGQMAFDSGAGEAMRIDGSSNVGIGTSSPGGTYGKLTVAGGVRTVEDTSSKLEIGRFSAGAPNSYIKLSPNSASLRFTNAADDTDLMVLMNTGNLGIGTTSAVARLTAVGSATVIGQTNVSARFSDDTNSTLLISHPNTAGNPATITGNNQLAFATGTLGNIAERVRIDAGGNVGIGTTIPGAYGGRLTVGDPGNAFSNNVLLLTQYATATLVADGVTAANGAQLDVSWASGGQGPLRFTFSSTERMRLTSAGALLIGTTTTLAAGFKQHIQLDSGQGGTIYRNSIDGSYALQFLNAAGSTSGWVQVNASSTTYNSISDVRLKHDIVDAPEASSLIDAIQVRSFKWNADNTEQRYGFIAQELVAVAPEAVSQPADPDKMMGVDYSKLVPMLVKEVQSLRARVAQLEGN